jgi:hypothetical protein
MKHERLLGFLMAIALAAPAALPAAAPEPLIVTQLPDPDPYYVPPPQHGSRTPDLSTDLDPMLDLAIQDFSRALGEAAAAERRAVEARCQSGDARAANGTDRFAWAASCRYSRH